MKSPVFEVNIAGMTKGMHSIIIPSEIAEKFKDSKDGRVKVEATFKDKKITIHSKLQKDKAGNYRITFGQKKQKELGIFPTDYFNLQLFENTSKYGVEMPEELDAVLLSDYDAFQIFEALTPGKQRSIIYGILRYKNSQTRIDKSILVTENLKRDVRDTRELFKNF